MSDTQDPNAPHASAQGVDRKEASGCPVAHGATATGSESENPAIDSPTPATGTRPRASTNSRKYSGTHAVA